MKKIIILCLITLLSYQCKLLGLEYIVHPGGDDIVKATKRIYLPEYPGSYNPSLIKYNDNYIMTFRYQPHHSAHYWISYIGIVLLDSSFNPISKPQLLNTRLNNEFIPSQSEDARIFSINNRIYLFYNDNEDIENPNYNERRDMFIAELFVDNDNFVVGEPLRLVNPAKYRKTLWQKNWSPFEWDGKLMLSYSVNPHEVMTPNLKTGSCQTTYTSEKVINWDYGSQLRGGTPAQLVDGEYLAFFHTGVILKSGTSDNRELWHYFMGAYTFSAEPPFEITSTSPAPIDALGFYTYSSHFKRIIYPSGFVVEGNNLYLAYGKDDSEVWIATMDLGELKKSLVPVQEKVEAAPAPK